MKIVWLCNTIFNEYASKYGLYLAKPESWIRGVFEMIRHEDDYELMYLFPNDDREVSFRVDNTLFISYPQKYADRLEENQVSYFIKCIDEFKPDVIHIFGTEYSHALAMQKACERRNISERIIASIQGLVSVYAMHYYAFLPNIEIRFPTLRDIYRKETYKIQKKDFEKRGGLEKEFLNKIKYVIGRTDWDYACTNSINPNLKYYVCNETLRDVFYISHKWNLDSCERHSIFVSQSNYPIKGFHLLLKVMDNLIDRYPDIHIYTTGDSPIADTFKNKIRYKSYDRYLTRIIKKLKLSDHITFLGMLNEKEMCEQFLKSNVFICCSVIENSPNSLGEAMLLGVPSIVSDVGGVKNLLTHENEGYLYPVDESYMIPYYIRKIFDNDELALSISKKAIVHAEQLYDRNANYKQLLDIYEDITSG